MSRSEREESPARIRADGIWFDDHSVLMESLADVEMWGVPGGGLQPGESLTAACTTRPRCS
ncbi:hypothetical protein ABZ897_23235 [Nonomuraea sp. NPDC046802]|uniref:hypothetical protein n=1 Tax=Nonomuraea sp. NPDC046802 TaxID=3154919 RepID=UPI0033F62D3E